MNNSRSVKDINKSTRITQFKKQTQSWQIGEDAIGPSTYTRTSLVAQYLALGVDVSNGKSN